MYAVTLSEQSNLMGSDALAFIEFTSPDAEGIPQPHRGMIQVV